MQQFISNLYITTIAIRKVISISGRYSCVLSSMLHYHYHRLCYVDDSHHLCRCLCPYYLTMSWDNPVHFCDSISPVEPALDILPARLISLYLTYTPNISLAVLHSIPKTNDPKRICSNTISLHL